MRNPQRVKRTDAYVAMSTLSSRMSDVRYSGRPDRAVVLADLRTSMCDQRVALSLAVDGSPDGIDRDGYRIH